jgi:hypothetical protein
MGDGAGDGTAVTVALGMRRVPPVPSLTGASAGRGNVHSGAAAGVAAGVASWARTGIAAISRLATDTDATTTRTANQEPVARRDSATGRQYRRARCGGEWSVTTKCNHNHIHLTER